MHAGVILHEINHRLGADHRLHEHWVIAIAMGRIAEIVQDGAECLGRGHDVAGVINGDRGTVADDGVGNHDHFVARESDHRAG